MSGHCKKWSAFAMLVVVVVDSTSIVSWNVVEIAVARQQLWDRLTRCLQVPSHWSVKTGDHYLADNLQRCEKSSSRGAGITCGHSSQEVDVSGWWLSKTIYYFLTLFGRHLIDASWPRAPARPSAFIVAERVSQTVCDQLEQIVSGTDSVPNFVCVLCCLVGQSSSWC